MYNSPGCACAGSQKLREERALASRLFMLLMALLLVSSCTPARLQEQPAAPTPAPAATAPAPPGNPQAPAGSPPSASSPAPFPTAYFTTRPVSPGTAPDITAAAPAANTEVRSPLEVRGTAVAVEARVHLLVKNSRGEEIGRGAVDATVGAPERGDYRASVPFTLSGGRQPGSIEVFTLSPRDGSVIDKLTIPVILVP